MDFLQRVLKAMDRTPKAKRRFNPRRAEKLPVPAAQSGLSVLASFVLFSSLPLAGFCQIRSDLDPSLNQRKASSRVAEISRDTAALAAPFCEMSSIQGRIEEGPLPVNPAQTEGPDNSKPAASQGRENIRNQAGRMNESRPQKARRSRPVQAEEEVFYKKAQGYHREKNFEMAIEMYRRVLQENPEHRDALFHLSSIYMERSQYAEAYPLVKELVRLHPEDPQGLANLAITEIALGRPEVAVAQLDKALALEDPPRFKIYFHKGVALSKLHRLEEAITWYKKSENLDPGHAPLLFNMAVTFDRLERYDEALDCYTRFLKAGEPSSPKERRDVEARIGLLLAYVAAERETSPAGAPQ